jgi:hypothetical protein
MRVDDSFLSLGHFKLNNGGNIRFWKDKWLGNFTLQQQFPWLYSITCQKNVSVASVFTLIPLNISFWRGLVGNNLTLWYRLIARVAHIRLNDVQDKFIWGLPQNGTFTVNSMYKALITNTRVMYNMMLWKLKIPLRNKIFMWYLKRGVVLAKDNLVRRNWSGNKSCVFCSCPKSIQHLFFHCHFARFLWRVVQITFNIGIPTSIAHLFSVLPNGVGNRF